jgi:hypothetical protein
MNKVSRDQLHRLVLAADVLNSELTQLMKQPAWLWEEGSCRVLAQLRERLAHGSTLTSALERMLLNDG